MDYGQLSGLEKNGGRASERFICRRATPHALKTGALAEWRGAFRLLEKTAGAALNNKVAEAIKAGVIDRYGLAGGPSKPL